VILPKDANLFVLQEAVAQELAFLGALVGGDPNRRMPWSGTISDAGWTYHLSSPYRDGQLSLDYVGTFNQSSDIISWVGTLNFRGGTDPRPIVAITTTGTYTDATVDGFWDTLDLVLTALEISLIRTDEILIPFATVGVQGVGLVGTVGPGTDILGTSILIVTATVVAGESIVGTLQADYHKDHDGDVQEDVTLGPGGSAGPLRSPPFSETLFGPIGVVSVGLSGPFIDVTPLLFGTVTISAIPGPSSLILVLVGIAGCAWLLPKRTKSEDG
jgi:hypothetical protein